MFNNSDVVVRSFADKNSGGEVSVLRTYRFYDIWLLNGCNSVELRSDRRHREI